MSFRSITGNPLGRQIFFSTPAFNAIASNTNLIVLTLTLPKGLWIVAVNDILATADNNATGSRLTTYKQSIFYGNVSKGQSAFIGITAISMQSSSVAIINCDGVTTITIKVDGQTNDNTTWSIDTGDVITTQLY